MNKDALGRHMMGLGLAALRGFASSPLAQKVGLLAPTERLLYTGAKTTVGAAARVFKLASGKAQRAERLPAPSTKSDLFDPSVSEEQALLREVAQRFAREVLRPAALGADAACATPEGFETSLADLALGPMTVPEALGGAATEASTVTSALLAEDLAWGDAGQALAALGPVSVAAALTRWGSAAQQAAYLPPFAETVPPLASLALSEPRPLFDPLELRTRAVVRGNRYVLNGEKSLVVGAERADYYLVAAELLGHGPCLFLVARTARGVTTAREPALGLRAAGLGRVAFKDVELDTSDLLGEAPGSVNYAHFVARSRIGVAALGVGVGQALLDYVIPYVNDRSAFGEPISHRQSVAFMVANLAVELEALRLVTWRAAARAEQGHPFEREAYLARVLTTERGMELATNGVQLLGGHGYIKEHPVERWYRDLMTLTTLEGGLLA